ncbi:hypothetical protein C2G38_825682 [Gigaspora rosea]|uniref:Uncharacterized protein n=1 Tax=Gigaspora rosea TaxID=44941 RepID=A0A397U1D4_9GLOM|nr:hypothetical protein C2G38_825682 [Gigaspora rosea]
MFLQSTFANAFSTFCFAHKRLSRSREVSIVFLQSASLLLFLLLLPIFLRGASANAFSPSDPRSLLLRYREVSIVLCS